MIARAYTVAFEGVDARLIEVQCAIQSGLPAFNLVGLANKAVSEAKERVRAAISSLGYALPSKRITVHLSPADLPKEGSHYDLAIALAILASSEALPKDMVAETIAMGELSLDGSITRVAGCLPAALKATETDRALLCPKDCASEAAWIDQMRVFGVCDLLEAINHLSGKMPLLPSVPSEAVYHSDGKDFGDVIGQSHAKRALEIAAAGRHNLLMIGPPGSGKSMLASRLPSIMPMMSAEEALETSMIYSISGLLENGQVSMERPFRAPHHTASMAAIIGGGKMAKPGEISLAHNGVLFLDELPEFATNTIESLRQPIEDRSVSLARAAAHIQYPSNFMLIAAANPCRCGHSGDPERACNRAPLCQSEYLSRISGPMLDRFDLFIPVRSVEAVELREASDAMTSGIMRNNVKRATDFQAKRYQNLSKGLSNSDLEGAVLRSVIQLDAEETKLLEHICAKFKLSTRGYYRLLRVARTIADFEEAEKIKTNHIAEAASYRESGFINTGL